MRVDVEVETEVSRTPRARQLEAMFDVPGETRHRLSWRGDLPIEDLPWDVGLIVGPSGCGKTTLLRSLFGDPYVPTWDGPSVIDSFPAAASIDEITAACQAVGFNTIPAWIRPYAVLSNGEQFRAGLARLMVDTPPDDLLIVDEFTSVVDRQVAKIASHAVAKWVRRNKRRLVAASCHFDIIEWLQPDWLFEPATSSFVWRSVQPRPQIEVEIRAVRWPAWHVFAPYHYLTAELNRAAQCFALFVDDEPASFAGVLHRPHARTNTIKGISRVVTLPDWQGLGLAFVLMDTLGAAYRAAGYRLRNSPAHPSFIRAHDRSPNWALTRRARGNNTSSTSSRFVTEWRQGNRPNAVFEYRGPADDIAARHLGIAKPLDAA
jgi:GNAT superfamily N-acetyltransferase